MDAGVETKKILIINKIMQINTKLIPSAPGVYIVGGTIRDMLMDKAPTDFDIAAVPPCEPLAREIAAKAGSRVVPIGKPGAMIYHIAAGDRSFDIAPLCGESIEADLRRRDFTVNAMAWDVAGARLIDPLSGAADLEARQIRMISPQNLEIDPIRLLRAFRLAAGLSFSIEADTWAAVAARADRIQEAAGERIREEWMKILAVDAALPHIREMDAAGLLTAIFPELAGLKHCRQNGHHEFDGFFHTLSAFSHLEALLCHPETLQPERIQPETGRSGRPAAADPVRLKLALLLHDIGKPACRSRDVAGCIHFYRHESAGADMAAAAGRRLRLSNRHQAYIDFIIRNHLRPLFLFTGHQAQKLTRKGITRFFRQSAPLTVDLLIHSIADARGKTSGERQTAFESFCRQLIRSYLDQFVPKAASPPLITGHDLIRQCGLSPSPLFSEILSRVETERLAGRLNSRGDALKWVKNFLNGHPHS